MIKKTLFALMALLLGLQLAVCSALPVWGDKGEGYQVGDKRVLDNGIETEYLGDGNWRATIGAPKYLDDLKTLINCSWQYDFGKGEYNLPDNLFDAVVKDTKVTVWYQGQKLSWKPEVWRGTKKLKAANEHASNSLFDPINDYYAYNTLTWDYDGITRSVRVIEGMLQEYYTISTVYADSVIINPYMVKDAGFTWNRPTSAWDADHKPVELILHGDGRVELTAEAMSTATLPITIDPDTSFTSTSTDGGWWLWSDWRSNTPYAWSVAHDTANALGWGSGGSQLTLGFETQEFGGDYFVTLERATVFFNTEPLPDAATITAVTLSLYGKSSPQQDYGAWTLRVQSGMPTYPHDPLVSSDYYYIRYSGDGGGISSASLGTGYKVITLTATGRSWVNKSGITKFMLREDEHDVDDVVPAPWGDYYENFWEFYSYEKGTGYQPTLTVTYAALTPDIETEAATNVAKTTARLNSSLVDDGGEGCQIHFGYGNVTMTSENFTLYDFNVTLGDNYTSGTHPFYDAANLSDNNTYYFRARAQNSTDNETGDELSFTTQSLLQPPTNVRAYPSDTSVTVSWTRDSGATQDMLRYKFDSYPLSTSDGEQLYEGTDTSYVHTGLSRGTTIYYALWGESGGAYSTSNVTVMATTLAGADAGDPFPTPPEPSRWMASPNSTAMMNIPIVYDPINNLSDSLSIPRGTAWLGLAILFAVFFAGLVYKVSHSWLGALIAMLVVMTFGWRLELIPLWMLFVIVVVIIGIAVSKRQVAT